MDDDRLRRSGSQQLSGACRDPGMRDLLQVAPGLTIGEDQRPQRSAVEDSILLEYLLAEARGNRRQAVRADGNDLAGQLVGIDDDGSKV